MMKNVAFKSNLALLEIKVFDWFHIFRTLELAMFQIQCFSDQNFLKTVPRQNFHLKIQSTYCAINGASQIYIPGKHKTWCLLGYWHARETQDLRWLLTQRRFRFRKCLNSSSLLLVGVVLNWRFRANRILLMMDQIRGQAAHGNMGCRVSKGGTQN